MLNKLKQYLVRFWDYIVLQLFDIGDIPIFCQIAFIGLTFLFFTFSAILWLTFLIALCYM